MNELINRDSLKAKLNWLFSHGNVSVDAIFKVIDEEPAVEIELVLDLRGGESK